MKNLTKKLIKFDSLEWKKPKEGVSQKIYSDGTIRMRLLRFDDTFVEEEWCQKGHIGYVLIGEMIIDFDGIMKKYEQGDGLWIEKGSSSKHKVSIEKGKQIELILFESEE